MGGEDAGIGVLVVADDEALFESLAPLLSSFTVLFVPNAEDALGLLEDEAPRVPIKVVVSQHRLRGISGAQLLSQVKSRYPYVGRILVSDVLSDALSAAEMGGDHAFLRSPINQDDLLRAIEHELAQTAGILLS